MNDKLVVLNLLEEERITFEEALQLLSVERVHEPPHQIAENPRIEVNLIFERGKDVRD